MYTSIKALSTPYSGTLIAVSLRKYCWWLGVNISYNSSKDFHWHYVYIKIFTHN